MNKLTRAFSLALALVGIIIMIAAILIPDEAKGRIVILFGLLLHVLCMGIFIKSGGCDEIARDISIQLERNNARNPINKWAWRKKDFIRIGCILIVPVMVLAYNCLKPGPHIDYVSFSNDSPVGAEHAQQASMPESITGIWADLNFLGKQDPATNNASAGLKLVCKYFGAFLIFISVFSILTFRFGIWRATVLFWFAWLIPAWIFLLGGLTGLIENDERSILWVLLPIAELAAIPSFMILMVFLDSESFYNEPK